MAEKRNPQVLVSRSSSEGFFSLLQTTLATVKIMMMATTNVTPDTSQLITMGLRIGSESESRAGRSWFYSEWVDH